jgi:hypothetical protein
VVYSSLLTEENMKVNWRMACLTVRGL